MDFIERITTWSFDDGEVQQAFLEIVTTARRPTSASYCVLIILHTVFHASNHTVIIIY